MTQFARQQMATSAAVSKAPSRLEFVDNIRWAMVVLVIFHHSAVTYSHFGSWFYTEDPEPELLSKLLMGTFLAFNQAYFMGFLFLIAGYFAAPSLDRKGFPAFSRDRMIRLGIPSLFFMLVIYPFTVYWLLRIFYEPGRTSVIAIYPSFISSGRVLSASGPMWFALALLLFSLAYGLLRCVSIHKQVPLASSVAKLPSHRHVLGLIAALSIASFTVRIFQPVGTSVLNMQLANFSQYIILFSLGILAYRGDWLRRIPFAFGKFWLGLTLTAGLLLWFAVLASAGVLQGKRPVLISGGLHWQSFLYCFWESVVCMGMSLGVLVLFRDRLRVTDRFSLFMNRNAFAAYLFHTPVLVAVTLALRSLHLPPLGKFILAGAMAVVLTFLLSECGFRRTPLLKTVL